MKTTVLAMTVCAVSAGAPNSKTVSVSTDTTVNGLDGLNLKLAVPFKVDDYVVGFRYKLAQMKKVPESLFAKRSLDIADGTATVDADYELGGKTLNIAAKWVSDKLGLSMHAEGNTKDKLTEIGASTKQEINGKKITLTGDYDLVNKKLDTTASLNLQDTTAEINYNNVDKDVVLAVSHDYDNRNTISPSISLTSGHVTYGWTRKWDGGSLETTYHPGDKAVLEWQDKGASGTWKTKASIPVENHANTKVSITRDWVN